MSSNTSTVVLVTGGTGFIGSHLILQLLKQGYAVRTTVRSLKKEDSLREALHDAGITEHELKNFSAYEADLLSDEGWQEAIEGATYVHHVASPFPLDVPKDENELIKPAKEGTLRVLSAARAAKVNRVILTSSVAAISAGHQPRSTPFTEEDWSDLTSTKPVAAYPKSKTIAEKAAWEWAKEAGNETELVVVNPVLVLGPIITKEAKTSVQAVKKLMDGSVPGCPALYVSSVDVRDVAALHILAQTTASAAGERFIAVSDEKPELIINIGKIIREKRPANAKKVPTLSVPNVAVRVLSWFDSSLKMILPELGHMTDSSNEKAKTRLGWKPRSVEDSVIDTADSLVKMGMV